MIALKLDGSSLSVNDLVHAANSTEEIVLDPSGLERMFSSRRLIDDAIETGKAVYGVTRGLGAKAVETLNRNELAEFSIKTVRGRAHAIGENSSPAIIRAAMIVRANSLMKGYSGARPKVAEHLVACLNANITPVVGCIGSVGVADLLPNAGIGLALIGEGQMMDGDGQIGPSDKVMSRNGIAPLELEARDGLALASNSSYVAALAAIALEDARHAYQAAQSSAALSLEAFRANLSALDERALSLRSLPGQMESARDLRARLTGSALFDTNQARRIQDPLSLRNVPQIHGTVCSALAFAGNATEIEINGVSDNPVVLYDDNEIISCGLYFTSELCNSIDTVSQSFAHLASAQLARSARQMDAKLTELPSLLTRDGTSSAGLAPLLKAQEALFSELVQATQTTMIWPSTSSSGVEDCVSGAPTAVKSLVSVADLSLRMSAIEMLIACQAFEMRQPKPVTGAFITSLISEVQKLSPRNKQDYPLSDDIERIFESIKTREMPMNVFRV